MTRIVSCFFSILEFIIVSVQFCYRVIMTLIYYKNLILKLDTSCRIGYLVQIKFPGNIFPAHFDAFASISSLSLLDPTQTFAHLQYGAKSWQTTYLCFISKRFEHIYGVVPKVDRLLSYLCLNSHLQYGVKRWQTSYVCLNSHLQYGA